MSEELNNPTRLHHDIFTPEQQALLNADYEHSNVLFRKGAGDSQLAYFPGHLYVETANKIFGHGNWGYSLIGPVELVGMSDNSGTITGYYYAARIRLEVRGCMPIEEEGTCPVSRTTADDHDKARKGAITDAMKRALRIYGEQFGLSLYDKTELAELDKERRSGNNQQRPANNYNQNQAPKPVQAVGTRPAPVAAAPAPARVVPQPPAVNAPAKTNPAHQNANGSAPAVVDPQVLETSYRRRLKEYDGKTDEESKTKFYSLLKELADRVPTTSPARAALKPLVDSLKAQYGMGNAPAPVAVAVKDEEPDLEDFLNDNQPPF